LLHSSSTQPSKSSSLALPQASAPPVPFGQFCEGLQVSKAASWEPSQVLLQEPQTFTVEQIGADPVIVAQSKLCFTQQHSIVPHGAPPDCANCFPQIPELQSAASASPTTAAVTTTAIAAPSASHLSPRPAPPQDATVSATMT
jgi:hypothetical protein